eukprot:TRINITY_DN836_c0_g2_i1.p1 TRINITY_DN836_c0_g2~~TRINITY_DN836_c0_g2_i1.p1  ORF type:complete len:567 (-),score=167.82 TRINITY_DN836_c0_g2_i1:283-1983(-)
MSKEKMKMEENTTSEALHSVLTPGGSSLRTITVKDQYVFSLHQNNTVRMWDSSTYKEVSNFVLEGKVGAMELRLDFLYISLDNNVLVWDAKNHKFLKNQTFQGHTEWVTRFAISGGILYTASNDKTVRGFNIINGKCVRIYEGHSEAVACLDFSGHYFVTGSQDKSVKVWKAVGLNESDIEMDVKNPEVSILTHSKLVFNIKIIGHLVYSASKDGTLRVTDMRTGEEKHCYRIEETIPDYLLDFKLIDGEETFIWSLQNHQIHAWNMKTGKFGKTFVGHRNKITCIKKNEQYLYSGSEDLDVRQWSLKDGSVVRVMRNFTKVMSMALGNNNRLYVGGEDGHLKVWTQFEIEESEGDFESKSKEKEKSSFSKLFGKSKSEKKSATRTNSNDGFEGESSVSPIKRTPSFLFGSKKKDSKAKPDDKTEKTDILRTSSDSPNKASSPIMGLGSSTSLNNSAVLDDSDDLIGWYLGPVSREKVESILVKQRKSLIIVRNSLTVEGCFALTKWVAPEKAFQHLLIHNRQGRYSLSDSIDPDSYGSLWELVSKSIECKGFALGIEVDEDEDDT